MGRLAGDEATFDNLLDFEDALEKAKKKIEANNDPKCKSCNDTGKEACGQKADNCPRFKQLIHKSLEMLISKDPASILGARYRQINDPKHKKDIILTVNASAEIYSNTEKNCLSGDIEGHFTRTMKYIKEAR